MVAITMIEVSLRFGLSEELARSVPCSLKTHEEQNE